VSPIEPAGIARKAAQPASKCGRRAELGNRRRRLSAEAI